MFGKAVDWTLDNFNPKTTIWLAIFGTICFVLSMVFKGAPILFWIATLFFAGAAIWPLVIGGLIIGMIICIVICCTSSSLTEDIEDESFW